VRAVIAFHAFAKNWRIIAGAGTARQQNGFPKCRRGSKYLSIRQEEKKYSRRESFDIIL
jgi:hypothetical protein